MSSRSTKPTAAAASPIMISAERNVARALRSAELPDLESALRGTLGSIGTVTAEQDALIWQLRRRRVVVSYARTASGGVVRVEESLQRMASSVFGGIMGGLGGALSGAMVGAGLGLDLGGTPWVPLALGALIMVAAFGLARVLFFREARKRDAQINALADSLAQRG